MKPNSVIILTPGKRVLFLTKDPDLIRRQLAGEDLQMKDLRVEDLMDDINTDMMTPAWVCFDYKPEDIARNAYAGLIVNGERVVPRPETKPRPMTMGEKILARHVRGAEARRSAPTRQRAAATVVFVKPGDAVIVDVDGGYTHEFTTAQVHYFLEQEYGSDY